LWYIRRGTRCLLPRR